MIEKIIKNDIWKREKTLEHINGDMTVEDYLRVTSLNRRTASQYIRFYRSEQRKEMAHYNSIGECNFDTTLIYDGDYSWMNEK